MVISRKRWRTPIGLRQTSPRHGSRLRGCAARQHILCPDIRSSTVMYLARKIKCKQWRVLRTRCAGDRDAFVFYSAAFQYPELVFFFPVCFRSLRYPKSLFALLKLAVPHQLLLSTLRPDPLRRLSACARSCND